MLQFTTYPLHSSRVLLHGLRETEVEEGNLFHVYGAQKRISTAVEIDENIGRGGQFFNRFSCFVAANRIDNEFVKGLCKGRSLLECTPLGNVCEDFRLREINDIHALWHLPGIDFEVAHGRCNSEGELKPVVLGKVFQVFCQHGINPTVEKSRHEKDDTERRLSVGCRLFVQHNEWSIGIKAAWGAVKVYEECRFSCLSSMSLATMAN